MPTPSPRLPWTFLLLAPLLLAACTTRSPDLRDTLPLDGTWQVALDTNAAMTERPPSFDATAELPGTLDANELGFPNSDTTDQHLARLYTYTGPAFYQREIEIPETWAGRHVELIMERTKVSRVWLDDAEVGTSENLFTPQVYDLTGLAAPGTHTLTIAVSNEPELAPGIEGSHAYSENTQTNWNGILGAFRLEASNPTRIAAVRVFPDVDAKEAQVEVRVANPEVAVRNARVRLYATAWNTDVEHEVPATATNVTLTTADTTLRFTYALGEEAQLWSEFDPALYHLEVTLLSPEGALDQQRLDFGLRRFDTAGTQFAINDTITFLRGKNDAAVFPRRGHPPMDSSAWGDYFRTAKAYGINHYRFHSWTPPAAAFAAADAAGIYMQPETPIWYGFDATDTTQRAFMMREGTNILDAYGNHASFVMFALGNEIWEDRALLEQMIDGFRAHDPRPLYAQGSNNMLSNPSYAEGDDFWTTFRTDVQRPDLSSDVRASISYLDSEAGGILNEQYPSTDWTYEAAIEESPVPVIGHEIGQYQIYPSYDEIEKYTGVLRPWNLELFRDSLAAAGMLDQADDFFRASGALAVLCYRADMEGALRTPGFGGYQLLDLQDFPGQGTALVGILDAFMDSKGLIEPAAFREFNDEVVVLLLTDRYTWTSDETLRGDVQVANYGPGALHDSRVQWRAVTADGSQTLASGTVGGTTVRQGSVTSLGPIEVDLSDVEQPHAITIELDLEDTPYETAYPAWVYPADVSTDAPDDVTVATALDAATLDTLRQGGRVLLFPAFDEIESNSVGGQFIPEFWNYGMFTQLAHQYGDPETDVSVGTMGLLTDPEHPLFDRFPTEFHSNWQWWPITKNSRPIILDETPDDYRPLVQVVDNINRHHKLGLVFEYRVGDGRLLVASADLQAADHPEMRQLHAALLDYAASDAFDPAASITEDELRALLYE